MVTQQKIRHNDEQRRNVILTFSIRNTNVPQKNVVPTS